MPIHRDFKVARGEYLIARKLLAAARLQLPTNKEFDTALSEFGKWKMPRYPEYYMSDTLLITPRKGETLKLGVDFTDNCTDTDFRYWNLVVGKELAEATNLQAVAILIDHPEIEIYKDKVYIIPDNNAVIFRNFPQRSGLYLMDENTALPCINAPEIDRRDDSLRQLLRLEDNAIRPIYRLSKGLDHWRVVGANISPSMLMALSFVDRSDGTLHALESV